MGADKCGRVNGSGFCVTRATSKIARDPDERIRSDIARLEANQRRQGTQIAAMQAQIALLQSQVITILQRSAGGAADPSSSGQQQAGTSTAAFD